MAGVERIEIRSLQPGIQNSLIIGIIIAKNEPKIFDSSRTGEPRGVLTLTVRDSKKDFINCVIWGSQSFIHSYNQSFQIGDVINILLAKICITMNEQFQPTTPSPFSLTINEGKGSIVSHEGETRRFDELLNVPSKPSGMTLSLADVNSNGTQANGELVDVLVVVRAIKPVRNIKTRKGKILQCREIIVMDRTCPGLAMTFWNKDFIERCNTWIPLKTILYLADIRIEYSTFYKSVLLGLSPKSIITENPKSKEADELIDFASNVPLRDIDMVMMMPMQIPDLASITTVMSVQQIIDRAEGELMNDEEQFTALLYAVVTRFDLDGCSKVVSTRCIHCNKPIIEECDQLECVSRQFKSPQNNLKILDIQLHLTDHTGTLTNCRLVKQYAETILGCTTEEFLQMSDIGRGQLKWKILMERCAIKLIVRRKSVCRMNTFITIVDCQLANSREVIQRIKIY